jgi:hypothetical protein
MDEVVVIQYMLGILSQIKLYHWQTRVYARHIATDTTLAKLEEKIDSFVEVYIGKYGRPRLTGKNASITLHNLTEAGAVRMINAAIKYVKGIHKQVQTQTDLINILDDMLRELGQLIYLFTLH